MARSSPTQASHITAALMEGSPLYILKVTALSFTKESCLSKIRHSWAKLEFCYSSSCKIMFSGRLNLFLKNSQKVDLEVSSAKRVPGRFWHRHLKEVPGTALPVWAQAGHMISLGLRLPDGKPRSHRQSKYRRRS